MTKKFKKNPQLQLQEIESRWDAATPGPWKACPYNLYIFGPECEMVADGRGDGDTLRMRGVGAKLPIDKNINAIANAPTDIAWLLKQVRYLTNQSRELADKNRKLVDKMHTMNQEIGILRAHASHIAVCDCGTYYLKESYAQCPDCQVGLDAD